jgi:hypothetical protein
VFAKRLLISSLIMLAVVSAAGAETAAPLPEPKPTFSPGMYETEARNSALPNAPVKSRLCIASADYDAFRDETIGQYRKSDLLKQGCKLGDTETLKNGFVFTWQCPGTKSTLSYEFSKDLVQQTIQMLIAAAPKQSSSILTMMRRVGDCP